MRVAVTGSTGFVGTALCPFLARHGHEVIRIVRKRPTGQDGVYWDPESGTVDREGLAGVQAIIHLAGESVASGRWTPEKKARIHDSRVQGTRLLAETVAAMPRSVKVFVSASAIGFYGNRPGEVLSEKSVPGTGFLADSCSAWEGASEAAIRAEIRVVHVRIGVVLGLAGGAISKMLPLFRLGLGGRLGSGEQVMSWISLDDCVGALHHALITDSLVGPVNAVAPNAVTNSEFTRVLAQVVGRPAILPAPAFMLRLMMGEFADEILLAGAHVLPTRLSETDYSFRHPKLKDALNALLKKGSDRNV